jgi:hypothetical protein
LSTQRPERVENLRQSYRCAVDGPRRQAMLRAGGDWTPVELVDESAGGFGVLAEPGLSVAVGDQVQLRTATVCFDVEVMHVADRPAPGDGDRLVVRLGLKRVGEVVIEPESRLPWFKRFRLGWRRAPYGSGAPVTGTGLLLVLLVGAVPAVAILLLGTQGFTRAKSDLRLGAKHAARPERWTIPPQSDARPDGRPDAAGPADPPYKPAAAKRGNTHAPATPDAALNESWHGLLDRARLQTDAGKWNDAALAVMANVTGQMSPSQSQQARIAEILQRADESLASLSSAEGGARNEQAERRRLSILENAYNQLIEQLTDAQKIQWAHLLKPSGGAARSK